MKEIAISSKDQWLEARVHNINSTESASLFGISPYMTKFEMWQNKKNKELSSIEETERMKWGTRLEEAIGYGIAEDEGLKVEPFKNYYMDEKLRMGSSFDFFIEPDGILEIKNVDSFIFNQQWKADDPNQIEAPLHIEMQVQHQLAVSGRKFAKIGVLVGGNEAHVIHRERDEEVISAIRDEIEVFWESIEKNSPPPINFEQDYDYVAGMFQHAEPGKQLDADEKISELARRYNAASRSERVYQTLKKSCKAEILTLIGDAEKVKGEDFTISAGAIGPKTYEVKREGYRNFRIHWKKTKKEKS